MVHEPEARNHWVIQTARLWLCSTIFRSEIREKALIPLVFYCPERGRVPEDVHPEIHRGHDVDLGGIDKRAIQAM